MDVQQSMPYTIPKLAWLHSVMSTRYGIFTNFNFSRPLLFQNIFQNGKKNTLFNLTHIDKYKYFSSKR